MSGRGDRMLDGRRLLPALYGRALAANALGATLAYVYLSFVAPPQPPPDKSELFLYLGVAPVYFLIAALFGREITKRRPRRPQPSR